MMDVTRGAHGEVLIRLEGTFDAAVAGRLSGWLHEVPETDPLVIDFSGVRTCQDFGLAAVARDLAARGQLVLRGLTLHQQRMLRYCGVEAARFPAGPGDGEALG
jgi:anti-anti-sigma regulatory factor